MSNYREVGLRNRLLLPLDASFNHALLADGRPDNNLVPDRTLCASTIFPLVAWFALYVAEVWLFWVLHDSTAYPIHAIFGPPSPAPFGVTDILVASYHISPNLIMQS